MAVVDVIVPAYNPGRFLDITLRSLLDQTHQDWRARVVDDGSDEPIVLPVSDTRITVTRQANLGLSAARNRGIEEGSAPLVAFLDADDLWLPGKLAAQVAEFDRRPTLGMLSTRFDIIDADGVVTGPGYEGHHGSYASLLQGNGVCVSTAMVRRAVLDDVGPFDVGLAAAQDWDLWLRIARGHDVDRVEEILAHYRLHGGGMSRNWRRTAAEADIVLARHSGPDARIGRRRARELASYQAFDAARGHWRAGNRRAVVSDLLFVARTNPVLLARTILPGHGRAPDA